MEQPVRIDHHAIGPQYGWAECMVEGCATVTSGWFTMCGRHWKMVPKAIPGDGSDTSEGPLKDAFWRHKPDWLVGVGAIETHRNMVELAIMCVEIQLVEEGSLERVGGSETVPSSPVRRCGRPPRTAVA